MLILKSFLDVLPKFKDQFTYRQEHLTPVPQAIFNLWIERGYQPSKIGIAYVKFNGVDTEYIYPAYFCSE